MLENIEIDDIEYLLTERYKHAKKIVANKIQKALYDTLAVALAVTKEKQKLPDNFVNRLTKNKDLLIEALEDSPDNQIKESLIKIIQETNKKTILEESNTLLANLLLKMLDELENEKNILSSIDALIDTFNDFLSKGKEIIIDKEKAYIKINNRKHDLNQLSSGEINLLIFLTIVLIDNKNRDFLIIDEPEISLNIKWQRKILDTLSKYAPKTQIILATHSPVIGKDIETTVEVIVTENKNNGAI